VTDAVAAILHLRYQPLHGWRLRAVSAAVFEFDALRYLETPVVIVALQQQHWPPGRQFGGPVFAQTLLAGGAAQQAEDRRPAIPVQRVRLKVKAVGVKARQAQQLARPPSLPVTQLGAVRLVVDLLAAGSRPESV